MNALKFFDNSKLETRVFSWVAAMFTIQNIEIVSNESAEGEPEIDLRDILQPELAENDGALQEKDLSEIIVYHPHERPLVNHQPEFFSSRSERMRVARPRRLDLNGKKAMQKRMRIIILIDIVLFMVILGVVYPSLRELQASGRLAGYHFRLSQSIEKVDNMADARINILLKIEQLAGRQALKDAAVDSFDIRVRYRGHLLLEEEQYLPQHDSPVSYALFTVDYREIIAFKREGKKKEKANSEGLDIMIRIGEAEKPFFLQLPLLH